MVSYSYRCAGCGEFALQAPMGSAQPVTICPQCASTAKRVYLAPRISMSPADPRMRLIDATKKSADEPRVVDAIPGSGVRRPQPFTHDPRHHSLPRP